MTRFLFFFFLFMAAYIPGVGLGLVKAQVGFAPAGGLTQRSKNDGFCNAKIFSPLRTVPNDEVSSLPGFGCVTQLQLAGYLPVVDTAEDEHNTSRLFYWFVASDYNPSTSPIVLWLNGGPGASSFYGFFTENGPYVINAQGTLSARNFAWTKKVNYLMIDNPAGVGFSYADPLHPVMSEDEATNNLYQALSNFLNVILSSNIIRCICRVNLTQGNIYLNSL